MAIGTVRVEMDDGVVYEGALMQLNYAPLTTWSGFAGKECNLNLVLSHCDITRPEKSQTQIEKIMVELVDAIKAEVGDV